MSAATGAPQRVEALIIGAGFAGIGMAVALRRIGCKDLLIVEKGPDVGGVWRDNRYPGAACDVPSHLYSFSFEPKADWSRVFASQPDIEAYLQHCADRYGLRPHLRLNTEVVAARFDETTSLWQVQLGDGRTVETRQLISAVGQLSLPALPDIPGLADFQGPCFHSARWDAGCDLTGRRVAVIGTGASAIQFVPAIAPQVGQLTVFQRSAPYVLPRPDRPYTEAQKRRFGRWPLLMRLHRARIYLQYEVRALGFTRWPGLMRVAAQRPFERLLRRQVPDAALRERLRPDYPAGCKRILLSSEYLATLAQPQVRVVTEGIRRITAEGVETADGQLHPADVLILGSGFAATRFLAPMEITGRQGRRLQDAWREGAQAYLGLTVPGFPNFFMLYGPNTNLGHNSIVYMLESQIAHVIRCLGARRAAGADRLEVSPAVHERFQAGLQNRLRTQIWSRCRNWYLDASGRNTTNWPGFTLTFRALTRWSPLSAYQLSSPLPDVPGGVRVWPPASRWDALQATLLRGFLRLSFRTLIGPPLGAQAQRAVLRALTWVTPGVSGVARRTERLGALAVEVQTPPQGGAGAILYLHGGAFCIGSPATHRSLTTRLARDSGLTVWAPDYRLAPEHPHPAGLQDALAAWQALRARGLAPGQIVLAGDSAGGALALALALTLKARGEAPAAALLLISPLTDPTMSSVSHREAQALDPLLRRGWVEQAMRWYAAPADDPSHRPLQQDLAGLPPIWLQVGEQEILRDDALALARHAAACGVPCQLELHAERWHVFQQQATFLPSARAAIATLAAAARERVAAATGTATPAASQPAHPTSDGAAPAWTPDPVS